VELPIEQPMNSDSDAADLLAGKIAEVETKLELLEREIAEIGLPAGYDLQKRLEALKIEEKALRRNFEESRERGEPDSVRLAKIETLLRHIENEEASVEHEAHFLHQSNPSSVILAAQAAAGMIDLWHRGIKKVLGDRHPFGSSVFVNHTHDDLVTDYGFHPSEKEGEPKLERLD
jgi:DNA repair exonuclease SbcCD ATPase subunit